MISLVKMKFGSWVYGTNIESSDIDIKEIFQPPAIDIEDPFCIPKNVNRFSN
jgi:hypothetical protein